MAVSGEHYGEPVTLTYYVKGPRSVTWVTLFCTPFDVSYKHLMSHNNEELEWGDGTKYQWCSIHRFQSLGCQWSHHEHFWIDPWRTLTMTKDIGTKDTIIVHIKFFVSVWSFHKLIKKHTFDAHVSIDFWRRSWGVPIKWVVSANVVEYNYVVLDSKNRRWGKVDNYVGEEAKVRPRGRGKGALRRVR